MIRVVTKLLDTVTASVRVFGGIVGHRRERTIAWFLIEF